MHVNRRKGNEVYSENAYALKEKEVATEVHLQDRNCWRVNNLGIEAVVYFVTFYKEKLKLFAAAYGT